MTRPEKRWLGARERRLDPGRRSLTASEAASIIGVSVATVRGWADQGRLPSHRTVGGHRRFELEELKAWLADHGAPVPRRFRPAPGRAEIPRCPELARELNLRTEAVTARLLAGYSDDVPTVMPRPTEQEARRTVARYVRVASAALESGNPGALAGRTEIAGFRGGLQGERGLRVLVEQVRLATAMTAEAEDAVQSGAVDEPLALESLQAVIEHSMAGLARGFAQAAEDEPDDAAETPVEPATAGLPAE
ncbi:MAG: helix-turn-helix domain-containing protein [Thermoleophilia bacterium]|jgi:excisionase family DNA binding protein|nr:helix-turn-helix domain-containing protein [Thermoleophilia bacterium]